MKKNDNKFKNICQFYSITHKLKILLRSGWLQWNISADRFESVAEHVYGTQMLAFAVISEFELDLNLAKVLTMLAFHELGETIIGDITILDKISHKEKLKKEENAVSNILASLKLGPQIEKLILEFDQRKTPESIFAYQIDKFECNFQVKYHEQMGHNDISRAGKEPKEMLKKPKYKKDNLAELWIDFHKENSNFDELFKDFSDYLLKHDIFKN